MELPRLLLPVEGVSDAAPFLDQPPSLAPPSAMRNVVPFDVSEERIRLCKRPGLEAAFGGVVIGQGLPVQAGVVVARASSVTGYVIGACEELEGASKDAGTYEGQLWLMESTRGMYAEVYAPADTTWPLLGGPTDNAVQGCCYVPTLDAIAFFSNFAGGLGPEFGLALADAADGSILDTASTGPAGIAFCNTIDQVTTPTGEVFLAFCAGGNISTVKVTGGTFDAIVSRGLEGWGQEAVEARFWTAPSGAVFLFVAFNGSRSGGSITGGTITAGDPASHFRSGVLKYRMDPDTGLLTQVPYGPGLDPSDPYYEANHGYFRVSEHTAAKPNGCLMTGLAVDHRDGSVVCTRTNSGYGPQVAFPPVGRPYITVFKITPGGQLAWEVEANPIRETGLGGYANDIPYPGDPTPDPALSAVRVCAAGDVVVGGRRGLGLASVFCLRADDGSERWRFNLMDATKSVRQAAIWIDPTDDSPIIAGDRNSSWTGSGGNNAHIWKLSRATGEVIWSHDLGQPVSALGVTVKPATGDFFYVTDKIPP